MARAHEAFKTRSQIRVDALQTGAQLLALFEQIFHAQFRGVHTELRGDDFDLRFAGVNHLWCADGEPVLV